MNKYKFLGLMVITISMYAMDQDGANPENTLSELENKVLEFAQTNDGHAVHDFLLDYVNDTKDDDAKGTSLLSYCLIL